MWWLVLRALQFSCGGNVHLGWIKLFQGMDIESKVEEDFTSVSCSEGCIGREEPLSKTSVNDMSPDGPSTVIFNKGCSKIQVAGSKWREERQREQVRLQLGLSARPKAQWSLLRTQSVMAHLDPL